MLFKRVKLTSFPTRFELGSVRSRISPVLGSGTGAQQHAAHHISSGLLSAPSGFAPSDGLFMMGFVFDFMISSHQERGSLPLGRVPLGPGRRAPVNLDTPGHPHGCGVLLGCPAARHPLHAPAEGKNLCKVPKYSENISSARDFCWLQSPSVRQQLWATPSQARTRGTNARQLT